MERVTIYEIISKLHTLTPIEKTYLVQDWAEATNTFNNAASTANKFLTNRPGKAEIILKIKRTGRKIKILTIQNF